MLHATLFLGQAIVLPWATIFPQMEHAPKSLCILPRTM